MMADLDKETVDFVPNYDETTEEPVVLPAPYPNLLVNGSTGIAVGMATNIPPHNLREVLDAVIWTIEATQSGEPPTVAEKQRRLLELVPGPDFPTGAYIVGRHGIRQAYLTGRGSILMRAKAEIEVSKKGDRSSIIISAIPYQVNKARLIERIAELVREKTIEGISDIRDESDRDGLRIAIDLKRGEVGEVVLNNLYKHTQLQTSFGVIMLAIVAGRPKVLTLVELIDNFIEFRREVVRRRTEFELRKAEARAHILEGLKIALDHLDAVIALIRASKNPLEARDGLMTQFGLSQIQSQAILDMQLQRLTGLERQKILDELAEVLAIIERLRVDSGQREAADRDHRLRAAAGRREVRRRSAHRDPAGGRRLPHRGPDRRGRHGDHGHEHRLHQAHRGHHLPEPAARRQGPHRHAHARRGLRQPPVRGLDPRLRDDLLRPRPRLLAEGPRDSGRRPGRPRQGDRQPRVDGGGRAHRGAPDACKEFEDDKFVVMGTQGAW